MINNMFNFIKKKLIPPSLPKIVICFTSTGCMGHINTFEWLGVVKSTNENGIHKVKVIISENYDARDKDELEEVAYTLQYLGFNIYVCYK